MRFRDPVIRERFEREGFVVVDLLDAAQVAHLRALWDEYDDPIKQMPFNVTIMSGDLRYRRRMHEEIAAIVGPRQQALLEGARFCYGSLVAKPPAPAGAGTVPLHQDPSFVDETTHDAYNFWVALQDVAEENGCLHVVKGSHVLNRFPRSNGAFFAFPYPELLDAIVPHALHALPVRCGQAVITYQTLFHMSFPNRGERTRLAASALAVPQGVPLRHYYQPFGRWEEPLEVYEVDEDFYVHHTMNQRPQGARYLGSIDARRDTVSPERLMQAVRDADDAYDLSR